MVALQIRWRDIVIGSIRKTALALLSAFAITTISLSAGSTQQIDISDLRAAADAGDTEAQRDLGAALVFGTGGVAQDVNAGVQLLELAAAGGDVRAKAHLGKILFDGFYISPDHEIGAQLLEEAVAAGNTEAQLTLGAAFLWGENVDQDPVRALALFEEAAEAGDGRGLQQFGSQLMWSQRNAAEAEIYLRRSGELGVGAAWSSLAEGAMYGYLGPNSRGKFDEFAARARDAGENRIAILEAQRRMWGISMRASGPGTLEVLEQAAEAGNADALKFLISLVRNGNRYNIRKEPERAREYLDRFATLLTSTEIEQLSLTIDATRARNIPEYRELATQIDARPELKSVWFGRELFAANPNVAIFMLQSDMSATNSYAGALNGLATKSTLRALLQECRALEGTRDCRETVLHPDVIGALLAR